MKTLICLADHAHALGVSVKTVLNALARDSWPAKTVKVGRARMVSEEEHDRLVEKIISDGGLKISSSWRNGHAVDNVDAGSVRRKGGSPRKSYVIAGVND